jgi:hypothetical protein
LSSGEILDEGLNEWHAGPELPFDIAASQMVEDQNGGVVLIGGIFPSAGFYFHLPQEGETPLLTPSINFHMGARIICGPRWNRNKKRERYSFFDS